MRAHLVFEKFEAESDPIADMKIGVRSKLEPLKYAPPDHPSDKYEKAIIKNFFHEPISNLYIFQKGELNTSEILESKYENAVQKLETLYKQNKKSISTYPIEEDEDMNSYVLKTCNTPEGKIMVIEEEGFDDISLFFVIDFNFAVKLLF